VVSPLAKDYYRSVLTVAKIQENLQLPGKKAQWREEVHETKSYPAVTTSDARVSQLLRRQNFVCSTTQYPYTLGSTWNEGGIN